MRPRKQKTPWTPEQLAHLDKHYADTRTEDMVEPCGHPARSIYAKAHERGLAKSEAFFASPASGRTNGRQGMGTRFEKGHQSWNKGKHYIAGGRSAETRFKKGQMTGAAQHNYVPIGSLRLTRDGYLERKVTDDPKLTPTRRWVPVHRLIWIAANGPLPPDHIVAFKPGMRTNVLDEITLDKVELISRAENMQRNTLHRYPKEVVKATMLRGALTRQINKRSKEI